MFEESADCRVTLQADRYLVGLARLIEGALACEQLAARGPIRLILGEARIRLFIGKGTESSGGAFHFRNCKGAVNEHDGRPGQLEKCGVKFRNVCPVAGSRAAPVYMRRLHGSFQLEAANVVHCDSPPEQSLALSNLLMVPKDLVLHGKRNKLTGARSSRASTGLGVQEQRQKPQRLGFFRQQGSEQPGKEQPFFSKVAPRRIQTGWVRPALGKGSINGIQNRVQTVRQLFPAGNTDGDAGFSDLFLGAYQALSHCRRGSQKSSTDAPCIKPQHHLQHKRGANDGVNGWMRAGKHHGQPFIRNLMHLGFASSQFELEQFSRGQFMPLRTAKNVDRLAPRRGKQPGFRVDGAAVFRPIHQRRGKGFRERIFGGRDIPRAHCKKSDELAVASARYGFCS